MISICQRHATLRASLQGADGGAVIACVVGSAVSPAFRGVGMGLVLLAFVVAMKGRAAAAGAGVSASAAEMLDFGGGWDEAG